MDIRTLEEVCRRTLDTIHKEAGEMRQILYEGGMENMEHYRHVTGQLLGMDKAATILEDVVKKMYKEAMND